MTNELLAEVSLLRDKVKKYEEAWRKVVEDIKTSQESIFCTEEEEQGLDVAKMIIDKYLTEVEK